MRTWTILGTLGLAAFLSGAHPEDAKASWPPYGLPVCVDCAPSFPAIRWDGEDGVYLRWSDGRTSGTTDIDIFAQRITSAGAYAPGWPSGGAPVCVSPRQQYPHSLERDPAGGVFIAWTDFRTGVVGGPDVYAQRLLPDGTVAPGWTLNGNPVTRAFGYQSGAAILPDGTGGAFITYDEDERWPDIYLQHLTATGEVAPGYPANGLPICTDPAAQGAAQLVPDGAGGLFIAWSDIRDGPFAAYAQHVLANGQIDPSWPVNGKRLVLGRALMNFLPDGTGGMYVSSATVVRGFFNFVALYLQRFAADGSTYPGWPEGGVPVCLAPEDRDAPRMISDDAGGVFLTWTDNRDYYEGEIFLQRVRPDGSLSPGWPVDGLRLTDNSTYDYVPQPAPDGAGGTFLCWNRTPAPFANPHIRTQHVTASGTIAAGWVPDGYPLPIDSPYATQASIAYDGRGGAIVAWEQGGYQGVRAQRLVTDGPVAVELALVSATVEPGRVSLKWFGAEAAGISAVVERRTEAIGWEPQGTLVADGSGHLRYEDAQVTPGGRYAYRLSYRDGGATRFTPETWVDVPSAVALTLQGFQPNPSVGAPLVAFSLPTTAAGRLELFDLAGRRVAERDLAGLPAGRHLIRLDAQGEIKPGAYAVRLQHGDRVVTTRGVVVR